MALIRSIFLPYLSNSSIALVVLPIYTLNCRGIQPAVLVLNCSEEEGNEGICGLYTF